MVLNGEMLLLRILSCFKCSMLITQSQTLETFLFSTTINPTVTQPEIINACIDPFHLPSVGMPCVLQQVTTAQCCDLYFYCFTFLITSLFARSTRDV